MNMNWNRIIDQLPGVYLSDQHPPGSGIAVSVEKKTNDSWTIHAAREQGDNFKVETYGPYPASRLYEKLKELYREIGYTPQLNEEELQKLGLPSSQDVFSRRVFEHLPGLYIGAQQVAESGMDWEIHYSVQKTPKRAYTLFSCSARSDDDFLAEPEIEELGVFPLHDLLEELRIYGFYPDDYAELCVLHADSWQEVLQELPGRRLEKQNPEENGCVVSLVPQTGETWTLFYAVPKGTNTYRIHELANLSAKDIYKKIYDLTGGLLTSEDRKTTKLPSLLDIYSETLTKKMKGDYIGTVPGINHRNRYNETYFSMQTSKDDSRLFFFVSAEELITLGKSGRKIAVHKLGPYKEVDWGKCIHDLEHYIDVLELIITLDESKSEEVRKLSKIIKKTAHLDD